MENKRKNVYYVNKQKLYLYSRKGFYKKGHYLLFLVKEKKNDDPPDDSSSLVRCK